MKHLSTLYGSKYLRARDFNAKHSHWGSKRTPRGRIFLYATNKLNLTPLSTCELIYWPAAIERTPDLIDFAIIKGLSRTHFKILSNLELSLDHTPILVEYHENILLIEITSSLHNSTTNWDNFRSIIERKPEL